MKTTTSRSHKRFTHKANRATLPKKKKNVARVFSFILKTKHKTLYVKQAWAELENSAEKHSTRVSIDLNRSSQTELHNKFYSNSIPTLHKMHTL